MLAEAQNPNPSVAIDNFILDEMSIEHAPGMATLIVKDGEIVWVNCYGSADVEGNVPVSDSTVFMLASISKLFTGTALMHLYENGLIDLDEDINNYLPFEIDVPGFEADSITFRQLMTHTASIADGDAMDGYYSIGDATISLSDVIERYFSTSGIDYSANQNFSNDAPGTAYEYSNMGTALAGYMVEAVTGTDFSEYCNTHIFDELCMDNTSWFLADFDTNDVARPYQWSGVEFIPYAHYGFADYPDGQLRTNILDLAHFMIAVLQDGAFNGQQLLTEASLNEMLTPQIPALESTQGLNWYQELIFLTGGGTVEVWGHNGGESGVSTDMYINPDNNIGVAVLSNGEGDNLYVVDELYNYALGLNTSGVGNPPCNALSVEQQYIRPELRLYPNPALDHVTIKLAEDKAVMILDPFGRMVYHRGLKAGSATIQLSDLTPGTYVVRAIGNSGVTGQLLIVE